MTKITTDNFFHVAEQLNIVKHKLQLTVISNAVLVVVLIYPPGNGQRQTLTIERFTHFFITIIITSCLEESAPP